MLIERKVGDVKAVDGVSFDVKPGETLGLVGESGSGKSTTGYCVLQLLKPTAGSVRFEGMELTDARRAKSCARCGARCRSSSRTRTASLDPRMTVGDIVGEPLIVHGIGTAATGGSPHRASCSTSSASTRATRTAIRTSSRVASGSGSASRARSRCSPKLIVCDEPVSALDVSIQAQILNLLKDLQRDFGLAYLFIAHDLAVVRTMSDRIAVMNKGKLVEIGPAEEVYTNPQDDYTKALLSAVPIPDPRAMKERKAARRKLRHALAEGLSRG